jgi:hypothetical protein
MTERRVDADMIGGLCSEPQGGQSTEYVVLVIGIEVGVQVAIWCISVDGALSTSVLGRSTLTGH